MFTMRQFYEAVLRAHQRGVKVRMIADRSMIATSGTRVNQLQESGKIHFQECVLMTKCTTVHIVFFI